MLAVNEIRAVLFDLDGTLLDTASDMGAAINAVLTEQGMASLPHATLRPHVSHGANGLVRLAFGTLPKAQHDAMVARFLSFYTDRLAVETCLFEEMSDLLDELETQGLKWGIVTNKPARLTDPLIETLGLARRAGVVVSGDTLPERKPSPLPLLHAAERLQVSPSECIYVGDAERDMQAANAAGMFAVGARFGYIGPTETVEHWPAHGWIDSPMALLDWLPRFSGQTAQAAVR
jgi:N-acetyl-D-muramate 6-phosphate phosphatase